MSITRNVHVAALSSLMCLGSMAADAPLQIFDEAKYAGPKADVEEHTIYNGESIPGKLDRKISSLILKKGYQLCIATQLDGTGASKILIANKRDIRIPRLSEPFNDKIRFIRVLPFRNTVKKGIAGGLYKSTNAGWYYTWGPMRMPRDGNIEFVPQIQQGYHTKDYFLDFLINTRGFHVVNAFNEPSQKRGIKIPSVAVTLQKKVLRTGLRNGSVNPTEHGPLKKFKPITDPRNVAKQGWFREYFKEARKQGLRLDFICVHWYDYTWDKSKKTDDKTSPAKTFRRFKNYLTKVHKEYGLPIWITEFCLDTTKDPKEQLGFLKLALPWLESCPFIERYAYYQPNNGSGYLHKFDFRTERKEKTGNVAKWEAARLEWMKSKGITEKKLSPDKQLEFEKTHPVYYHTSIPLTPIGELIRDLKSTPSMPNEVYLGKSNLYEDEVEEKE